MADLGVSDTIADLDEASTILSFWENPQRQRQLLIEYYAHPRTC